MTDRQPGKPGRYTAEVTAEALEKLNAGEPFHITLERDDEPVTPGTPYNKASVLPDALAEKLCPGVADPTPADALEGLSAHNWVLELTAGGWEGSEAPYTQTLAATGMLATDCPHYGAVYSGTAAEKLAQKEAFALVDDLESANGSVTFFCFEEKPETMITVQLQVNR